MAGMPEIIDTEMPMMPASKVIHEIANPSNRNSEPTTRHACCDHRPQLGHPGLDISRIAEHGDDQQCQRPGASRQDIEAITADDEAACAEHPGDTDTGGVELEDQQRRPDQEQQVGHRRAGERVHPTVEERQLREAHRRAGTRTASSPLVSISEAKPGRSRAKKAKVGESRSARPKVVTSSSTVFSRKDSATSTNAGISSDSGMTSSPVSPNSAPTATPISSVAAINCATVPRASAPTRPRHRSAPQPR